MKQLINDIHYMFYCNVYSFDKFIVYLKKTKL